MKNQKHQSTRIAVGRSTARKLSAWRKSFEEVRGLRLDDEQLILLALDGLRYTHFDVADAYRLSALREMHQSESPVKEESDDALTSSDVFLNMDICPERFYTPRETIELLRISLSLLWKLEDRGLICRSSISYPREVLFSGEEIIKARSRAIPRRGKYKKKV